MTPDYQFDAEMRWNIDRYVLGDDTLDSELFEACMLEDEELAWAVADRISELQELTVSLRSQPALETARGLEINSIRPQSRPPRASTKAPAGGRLEMPVDVHVHPRSGLFVRHPLWIATVAASLLVVGFAWKTMYPIHPPAESLSTLTNDELVAVATTWMALEGDEAEHANEWLGPASLDMHNVVVGAQADEEDWLMDAASDFFEQLAAGEDS